jgi:hypothetical protein
MPGTRPVKDIVKSIASQALRAVMIDDDAGVRTALQRLTVSEAKELATNAIILHQWLMADLKERGDRVIRPGCEESEGECNHGS